MTIPQWWHLGWSAPLFNHLWQSTFVLLVAWLLTLGLRRNPARVRYSIWMLTSIKFLVPFALLADLGARWTRPVTGRNVGLALYTAANEIGQPFQQSVVPAARTAASAHPAEWPALVPAVLAAIWLCGCLVVLFDWWVRWGRMARIAAHTGTEDDERVVEALRRAETRAGFPNRISVRSSLRAIEPGVFGIIRPVLLWPAGISAHLNDAQVESIVAHEVEHVRRRDNLTAAIHMLVEAAFWFHPAVRWIGSRLMEERERACDEKVLELSTGPETYAASILKVCAFCLEPPAPCVAGVSGSDLKERVVRIMTQRALVNLSLVRKLALGVSAVLMLAVPLGFGVLHATQSPSSSSAAAASDPSPDIPKYEVATIKPSPASSEGRVMMMFQPDGTHIEGVPLKMIVREAFHVEDDRVIGLPAWVKTSRYDIQAKVAPEDAPKLEKLKVDQRASMLLPLLEDRFNLKYHHEVRELPSYSLVIAKGGSKLKASTVPDQPPLPAPGDDPKADGPGGGPHSGSGPNPRQGGFVRMMGPGHIEATGADLQPLTRILSQSLGRTVVDKTGLSGLYDYTLNWTPDNAAPPPKGPLPPEVVMPDPNGPSLFTALDEQLGLKLESEKGKVDVIVIDHIEPPSAN